MAICLVIILNTDIQTNEVENLQINSYSYNHLMFDKRVEGIHQRKIASSTNTSEKLDFCL